jgi:hypothetical protein
VGVVEITGVVSMAGVVGMVGVVGVVEIYDMARIFYFSLSSKISSSCFLIEFSRSLVKPVEM